MVGSQEKTCEDGAADAMPGTGNGTGQHGEGLSGEEGTGKYCR